MSGAVHHRSKGSPMIGVFFDDPAVEGYPLDEAGYRYNYRTLQQEVESRGARFAILRSQESYQGKQRYARGWRFEGTTLQEIPGSIDVDVVWNKGHLQADTGDTIINDPALDTLCREKWSTIQRFPSLHPTSRVVHSREECAEALSSMEVPRIVAKPIADEGGKGVIIGNATEILEGVTTYPYLLQSFIDTTAGIPGLVDGLHDVRIVSMGGTIALCYVRIPPKGQWTANLTQGGTAIDLPPDRIPREALAIFRAVDDALSEYSSRFYTVDMGRDRSGAWLLFELNSRPGFPALNLLGSYPHFTQNLAAFLIRQAQ